MLFRYLQSTFDVFQIDDDDDDDEACDPESLGTVSVSRCFVVEGYLVCCTSAGDPFPYLLFCFTCKFWSLYMWCFWEIII